MEPTSTLGELLRLLADRYGTEFRRRVLDGEHLGDAVMIVVNGDDVRPRAGLETRLEPCDVVAILPVMAGGRPGAEGRAAPFDRRKLGRLMDEAGIDLLLACSRHNVRYLTGGHAYHFHATAARMGRTRYLPFVGLPRGRLEEAFYVCRAEERGQIEVEGLWISRRVDAVRGTVPAAEGAVAAIRRLGLATGEIGVELPFLPADAFLALRQGLPGAGLVDATPTLEELRAVKTPAELARLRSLYGRLAEAIRAAFAAGLPGITTAEVARRLERESGRVHDGPPRQLEG